MQPIDPDTFFEMIETGALIPQNDASFTTYDVNFAAVSEKFPQYLEHIVLNSLNEIERWAYLEGYMTYTVREDGLLEWSPTGKQFDPNML
jgi:hypothetical protein